MPLVGLGETYDLAIGQASTDLHGSAHPGKRCNMQFVKNATVLFTKGAGSSGQDPVLTLKQHTALSGGTTTNLAVTSYWTKTGAPTLAGTEIWTLVTQAASGVITLTGMGANEMLVAISIAAETLTPSSLYISLDIGDTGASAQLGAVLYVLRVDDRRNASALPAALR